MAPLNNQKHETFCQEYSVDKNATQAAIRSGYSKKTAKSQGQRLLTNVDISQRIDELNTEHAEKILVTKESIVKELDEARLIALTSDDLGRSQPSAAISASMGKAKLFGLLEFKQKVEHDVTDKFYETIINKSEGIESPEVPK